jgi:hypothetical protein
MNFNGFGTDVIEVVDARIRVRIVSSAGLYSDTSDSSK